MAYFRYKIGREMKGFSDQALQSLCNYAWPGNVRELMNVIERAILLSKTDEIGIEVLPSVFNGNPAGRQDLFAGIQSDTAKWLDKTLPEVQKEIMQQVDRLYLEMALKKTRGRVDQTARMAGIHPRGLYSKMKQLGLRKQDFKN
jgi:DNA-binding NtrC family response regulator